MPLNYYYNIFLIKINNNILDHTWTLHVQRSLDNLKLNFVDYVKTEKLYKHVKKTRNFVTLDAQ